ncbi:MAG: pyridoxal-phosphate dependent enzyme [Nocardioides sp.]|uniref:pyridoxal-phosphate dependent enzyme n=1 Tax=Nocardioides sp. TaxID=35761 RepID=UPI0039E6EA81
MTGDAPDQTALSSLASTVAEMSALVADEIADHVVRTPLVHYAAASELCGARLLVKSEHQQRTGSFKVRGALAKILSLSPEDRTAGVVTASSGNHGLGVAQALQSLGGAGIICVPERASTAKVAALRRYDDVEVRFLGREAGETEGLARTLATELGMTYVSPYNDLDVIAGQGTVGREIVEQLGSDPVDAVVVAVGGGGLISGVAAAIKSAFPETWVIGASPANDAAMAASVKAERVVDVDAQPTISDGTAGGIESGAVTLPLCRELVDEWMLVTEGQIHEALQLVIDTEHQLVEGAAATAIAAALQAGPLRPGQTIAVVSCGANISTSTLRVALGPAA